MRKDVVPGPSASLDKVREDAPAFLAMAVEKLSGWDKQNYLTTVFARALQEAHALGAAGKMPKTKKPEAEDDADPVPKRVSRTRQAPEPTTRRRRTVAP